MICNLLTVAPPNGSRNRQYLAMTYGIYIPGDFK
jgi:hypothetical protein